jgi:cation:H+ antiporter
LEALEAILISNLETLPTLVLFVIIGISLFFLAKGADVLVEEAVSLSLKLGIPKMVIGATVVSLGTTLPEVSVSVMAAMNGNPDLALGNAIGSIIVDTGLILGIAAMIGNLPIDNYAIDRQGTVQYLSVLLLAIVALPIFSSTGNGNISQWMGFIFTALLVGYVFLSLKWAKGTTEQNEELHTDSSPAVILILKLFAAIFVVIAASKVLIPSVEISAIRLGIPQSIIAATLVAFGTSLPELITAITAVRKGHGELAVGNIMGADTLNVLFVTGLSAAFTKGGLIVPVEFYKLQIPAMIAIVFTFRFFAKGKGNTISKKEGGILLGLYGIYLALNYLMI